VLLDHIKDGSFSYRGVDALGQAVPWAAAWADGRLLPQLVRIDLQLHGNYDWPQLQVPLRVNPLSSGVPSGLQPLNPGGSAR